MASIEKRKSSDGSLSYHITVCSGYGANGKKNRRRMVFQAPRELSEKQADKEAQKEAFRFEQQLEQGYVADDQQKFRDYADYVLELKLRNGIKRSTYERYKTLLPKINAAVGNMRLKDIRPMHLNLLYAELGKPGMRENAQRSVPIQDIGALLKERHIKKVSARRTGEYQPANDISRGEGDASAPPEWRIDSKNTWDSVLKAVSHGNDANSAFQQDSP